MEKSAIVDLGFLRAGWLRWLPLSSFAVHISASGFDIRDGEVDVSAGLSRDVEEILEAVGGSEADMWLADNDEDRCVLQELKTRMSRIAHTLSIPQPVKVTDLFPFMEALGLLQPIGGTWRAVAPVPLPEEVLPLWPQEILDEDEKRWTDLHQGPMTEIVQELSGRLEHRISLRTLSEDLTLPVETTRAAMELLQEKGTIRTSGNVAAVPADTDFFWESD